MGFELRGSVSLDGSGFQSGLDKVEHGVNHLKGILASAFGIAAIEQAIHATVDYGAQISDTADRLGISTEALQEFSFAARMAGSDVEALIKFIEKLGVSRVDPKKWASFAALGVSNPLQGDVTELIFKMNANMRSRNPQEMEAPLRAIGERGSGRVMNFLRSDLEALTEEAHKMSQVMSTETIRQLKLLEDQFKIIGTGIKVFLGPALVWLGKELVFLANGIKGTWAFAQALFHSDPRISKALDPSVGAFFSTGKWQAMGSLFTDLMKTKNDESFATKFKDAFLTGMAKFMGDQDKFEAMLAKLGLPPPGGPPTFDDLTKSRKEGHTKVGDSNDSLLAVGNFLGSSRDVLRSLGERQLQVLQKIEANTKRSMLGYGFTDPDFPV